MQMTSPPSACAATPIFAPLARAFLTRLFTLTYVFSISPVLIFRLLVRISVCSFIYPSVQISSVPATTRTVPVSIPLIGHTRQPSSAASSSTSQSISLNQERANEMELDDAEASERVEAQHQEKRRRQSELEGEQEEEAMNAA